MSSLWQQMAIALAMTIVLILGSAAGYPYHSPSPSPPPLPYYYKSPPHDHPHHHPLIIMVIGEVYCFRCYDQNLHDTKHLLKDVTMEVICKAGTKMIKAYGKTKSNGEYNISVENFDYVKYGPVICNAKLYAPPEDSSCNIPTKLNEGTNLKVIKSKDKYELVLKAKPFAFATHDEKCGSPSSHPYLPYHYNSSPSPPPYYYQSSPLPKELPILKNKKKSSSPSPSPLPPPFPSQSPSMSPSPSPSPSPPPLYLPPFEFFMLVETWPTTYCYFNPCGNKPPPPPKFTIHGLWPQSKTSTQPFNCDTSTPLNWSAITSLRSSLETNWPDLRNNRAKLGYRRFWENEWTKHGTCASMDAYDYFNLALTFYANTNIRAILLNKGISPGRRSPINRKDIVNVIGNKINSRPQLHCIKYQNQQYLLEVRLCLEKSKVPTYTNCTQPWTSSCDQEDVYFP